MQTSILLVDDSRLARRKIETALIRLGVCDDVTHAESGEEAAQLAGEQAFDLVLCDVQMPGSDGYDFLRRKSANPDLDHLPVIMLTAGDDVEVKLKCLAAGASDYVLKPFLEEELVARVRIHLQLKALRDELRAKNESLEKLIRIDSLTGIANRMHLGEHLRRELSRAQRHELEFSLAIIDVDHFKLINDRFGHLVGDKVLHEVAIRINAAARTHDLVARFGGEEFAVVISRADREAANIMVERCRKSIAETPFAAGDEEIRVTVSAGVTSFPTSGAQTEDELLQQADEALYQAKEGGRDRVVLWERS